MKLFVLMSHKLSGEQKKELETGWQVDRIVYLPVSLQQIFSQIEPAGPLRPARFGSLVQWLKTHASSGDLAVVQGEYGLTVFFVDLCWHLGMTPLYAASRRIYAEESRANGDVVRTHTFHHENFRKYVRYENG